jgi:hypothetical protein
VAIGQHHSVVGIIMLSLVIHESFCFLQWRQCRFSVEKWPFLPRLFSVLLSVVVEANATTFVRLKETKFG